MNRFPDWRVHEILDHTDSRTGEVGYYVHVVHMPRASSYPSYTLFIPHEVAERWIKRLALRVMV